MIINNLTKILLAERKNTRGVLPTKTIALNGRIGRSILKICKSFEKACFKAFRRKSRLSMRGLN